MKTYKFNIYTGQQKFTLHHDDDNFIVGNNHGSTSDDVYANNYINELSYMELSTDNENIYVSFEPCTDENLLTRVREGRTKVRIQLLYHVISSIRQKNPAKESDRENGKYFHYLELPYGHYWENYSSPSAHGGYPRDTQPEEPEKFIRCRSHDPEYYGVTWLNLTEQQLRDGEAQLSNINRLSHGFLNYNSTINYSWEQSSSETPPRYHNVYQRFSVEMFCPALYRSGKDVFYYERENGIKYIADNHIEINWLNFI